jgi:antibiotic biosynthesis monooxygenase (ABM) superfamily enzyme
MITRIWRGWTTPDNADAYQRIVSTEVLPSIARREIQGYRGAFLLRREVGDEVEFVTILQFDSLDALREFSGEDYEKAYVPPQAREVLSRFDETSAHYETLMTPGDA